MKQEIYTIYDIKANAYLPPFFQGNDDIAKRMFFDAVADNSTSFHRHPEDYALFHIGSFDNIDGKIEPNSPRCLGTGVEFVKIPVDEVLRGIQ